MDVHDYHRKRGTSVQYAIQVEKTDAAIGKVLSVLEERGLLEDAWVILTSDHGESLGEDSALGPRKSHTGNPAVQKQLEIPLLARPAIFPEDGRIVRGSDVAPLLLERLGLPPLHDEAVLEAGEHYLSEVNFRTYRRGRYKLSLPRAGPEALAPRGHSRSGLRRRSQEPLLFDLKADPGETRNLFARNPEVAASLETRIDEISTAFAADRSPPEELSEEDEDRLRSLGYLD